MNETRCVLWVVVALAGCSLQSIEVDQPDASVAEVAQSSVLQPPRPQPNFAFCTAFAEAPIQCDPNQPNADGYCSQMCEAWNGSGGYCEDYTALDWRRCAATCDPVTCDTTFCFPDGERRCIKGQRP